MSVVHSFIGYLLIAFSLFCTLVTPFSVQATQRAFDYKLPFRNGETWKVSTNGIHQDVTFGTALDFFPVGQTSLDVIAPTSGTISRGCTDRDQTFLTLDTGYGDSFSLLHLQKDSVPIEKGIKKFVHRGDYLGKISTVVQSTTNGFGCTLITTGAHLHLGFKSEMCPLTIDSITFDCSDGADIGIQAKSTNIPDNIFNKNSGKIYSQFIPSMVFTVVNSNPADQTPVRIQADTGNFHQTWKYDIRTRQIIGLNDKCLDGGYIDNDSNNWLRIQSCNLGSNQQWYVDTTNRIHSISSFGKCIDIKYDMQFVYNLIMSDCNMNGRQRFTLTSDTTKSNQRANKIQTFNL